MKVLLLGAGGLLGRAFCEGLKVHELCIAERERLDIRNAPEVLAVVRESCAELIVNCAAHTDVDSAEFAPGAAYAVNSILPGLVAQACRRMGARMLHMSSTGCYGATLQRPYTEEDPLHPTTVHHRSKASGERAVRESGCESLILRTGWLFGGGPAQPKNFVWKRLQEAAARPTVASDTTQTGNPTWIADVVRQAVTLVEAGVLGTFNCVGQGSATRFDYVSAIVALSALPCRVEPSSAAFARAAAVSPNESAENFRLSLMGLNIMPPWEQSLERYIGEVREWPEWSNLTGMSSQA